MKDYGPLLNVRISLFLNDMLYVNLSIKLYLCFKSNRNTCNLPCYYFLFFFQHSFILGMCVYVGAGGHAHVWLAVVCMCGSQRTTYRGRFSPFSMGVRVLNSGPQA